MPKTDSTILYRSFQFNRDWLDEEKRESTISFSSEEEVSRWGIIEILDHSDRAVDLKRIRELGAHLFNHNPDRIIGPVIEAGVENGRGTARVGYDKTEEGNLALERTRSGSLRGVSVAYRVNEWKNLREGEEYQLATKKIRAQKGQDIWIATKWSPVELSSTPVPADSSVGHGRDLFMRSLKEAGITIRQKEECIVPMEKEEVQKFIKDEIRAVLPDAIKEGVKGALPEIRTILTEEQKPQMRMEMETAIDLRNRAAAVLSPEDQNKVADMIFNGKTEPEVLRFILTTHTGNPDARDNGGQGGDPIQRKPAGQGGQGGKEQVRSFTQLKDDNEFAAAFRGMDEFPLIQ